MDGGESRTDVAIARMFDELKYQSEINQSAFFKYASQYVKGVGRYLDTNEQLRVLDLMHKRGDIILKKQQRHNNASSGFSLIEGEDSELTQSLMTTDYIVDVTATKWPLSADDQKPNTGHIARLNFRDGTVSIAIDDSRYKSIASLSDGHKPFRLLEALFSKPVGVMIPSADIFNSKENLKQIISKSHLDYLLPFLDETAFPYSVSRKEQEIRMTPSELNIFLSKINEKYRNNFAEYL